VASGSFVNMSNGVNASNVGTTNFDIRDEVVYSFGDLGRRLTWIYYIEGETVANLAGTGRFQISLTNIWDGVVLDFYNDYYGSAWLEPTKWVDYDSDGDNITDGVIGTAGMAWWGAYGINTQAALDADLAAWAPSEEYWIFTARYDGDDTSLTSHRAAVPEPATLFLLTAGIAGLTGVRISRKKRATEDNT
ncbi:MAG: PEP-CTERM sorting domain-containing protein, partial [Gammaproteobacteria bacterium]